MSESNTSYTFHLPSSDQEMQYTLRGLNDDEIEKWTQFCEAVFAYKLPHPPPASYFARHFYNDPHRDASLVLVALHDTIVASCRVFRRTIVSPFTCQAVTAGGIGEVCTHEDHRRRGLSNQLLHQAISAMKSSDMSISFLHSAPTFFPVYQKAGYTCVRSRWSVVDISTKHDIPVQYLPRTAKFPDDTLQLQLLHLACSESRFSGCIIRTDAYWNDYIANELGDSLFVIANETEQIIGWMSIRWKNNRYQIREFGCGEGLALMVFYPLLLHCLQHHSSDAALEKVQVHMPTAILEDLSPEGHAAPGWIQNITAEDDSGWMYKNLENDGSATIQFDNTKEHLIWPSDSF